MHNYLAFAFLILTFTRVESQQAVGECCPEKNVGGIIYTLLSEEIFSRYLTILNLSISSVSQL